MRQLILLICCFVLLSCSDETHYAPVTDISTIEHIPKNGTYRVSAGETLYSIAWRYGLDYRYLANLNHIAPPFHLVAGQRIYLSNKSIKTAKIKLPKNNVPPTFIPKPEPEPELNKPVALWRWPARGPIIGTYSTMNKGLNIGGQIGNPIYATAAGTVVYSGNGLRGYGNLIIIKHNNAYLSAYAHNSVTLVKEGQRVKSGQEIAEMGNTGARQPMLHFEIRHNGQPINPLTDLN
jgi:lipoprotein NlpD